MTGQGAAQRERMAHAKPHKGEQKNTFQLEWEEGYTGRLRPAQSHGSPALVGLLTSEPGPTRPSHRTITLMCSAATMAIETGWTRSSETKTTRRINRVSRFRWIARSQRRGPFRNCTGFPVRRPIKSMNRPPMPDSDFEFSDARAGCQSSSRIFTGQTDATCARSTISVSPHDPKNVTFYPESAPLRGCGTPGGFACDDLTGASSGKQFTHNK